MIDRSLFDNTITLTCDESGCVCEQVYDPAQLDRSANPDETMVDVVISQARADGWVIQLGDVALTTCPVHRTAGGE